MSDNLINSKSIYFIGVGGIGVSAIARICLSMGKEVAGSDMRDSITVQDLKTLGAKIAIGHSVDNIKSLPDVVVYSEDISPDSQGFVELSFLESKGVWKLPYSKALGQLIDEKYGIGVSGTNGKSTTTALLALMLEKAGLDPSVVVGSKISANNSSEKFQANARLGMGDHFVAEADEYHRHMLDAHPRMIVLTNVAEDHLDYYKDLHEIKSAFMEYVKALPHDGMVIYNSDDRNATDVGKTATCHKFTFGIEHYADLQALNIQTIAGGQSFDLHLNDELIGRFAFHLPGRFNISNALGAALSALKLGVSANVVREVLSEFAGIWRRFEKVGEVEGKTVISDYAHHPAGVEGTIQAAKEFFPGKRILTVFQPHHRNRTKALIGQFVESLIKAEHVIMPEIFDVAGREHGEEISSQDLVNDLIKQGVKAEYAENLDIASQMIKERLPDFDVVLCMGAGDIDLMARKLTNA